MHVLQTVDGGGPAQALALARHAAAHGAHVVVVAPGAVKEEPGIRRERLPNARLRRAATLTRVARGADLLHVHGIRAGAWALAALPLAPSIVTLHGLHPLRRPAGPGHRLAGSALLTALVSAADAVICVSAADARRLRQLPVRMAKLHVVRNGVALAAPPGNPERRKWRHELGIADGTLAVLFLGRLTEQKDPLRALEVARGLDDQNVLFLMAGAGELEEEVRRVAPANVRILGHRNDVRRLLGAADVVLSTSLWEGLPLSVLEAMAAGKPVVASDVDGNSEALDDAGRLVAHDDVDGFRSALLSLQDPATRSDLSGAGRRRAADLFTLERMLAETDAVYADVLGRTPW